MNNGMTRGRMTVSKDLHPCFNPHSSQTHMRVHVPVAPKCNIQCNYCNRKYSCMNENRPGVTGNILSPHQALYYLERLYQENKNISVVGIAGPGDAMANPEETFTTLRLIRNRGIPVLFCLATNGLRLGEHIDEIAELRVSHVTVTMNAVDPQIGAAIYSWVRDGVKIYRGLEAAELLRDRQLAAIKRLSDLGVTVKVNSILIPGVNDAHIPAIAEQAAALGASIFNVMPLYPVADTAFEYVEAPSKALVAAVQKRCAEFIPMMLHCQRCRSDAAGFLHEGIRSGFKDELDKIARMPLNPFQSRDHIAVATTDGVHVDTHLGQAAAVTIYKMNGAGIERVAVRTMPPEGGGDERWRQAAQVLNDCRAIVVSHAGRRPQEILKQEGVAVYESNAAVTEVLSAVFNGDEAAMSLFTPKGCPGPATFGLATAGCDTGLPCSEKGCNGCGGAVAD